MKQLITLLVSTLYLAVLASCGVDTGGDHSVDVSDSTQTVEVRTETELSKVLRICEVEREDGSLVPYRLWTEQQSECINLFNINIGGLLEN